MLLHICEHGTPRWTRAVQSASWFLTGHEAGAAEYLWSDAQSGSGRLRALLNRVVNHLPNIPAAGGKGQVIHASHLLSKGADVKIINCLPPLSLRNRYILLFPPPGIPHTANNLKCSRTSGNHAIAVGLMI